MIDIPLSLSELPAPYTGDPPVISLKQALPFSQLSWENFERLCLRLAREYTTIEGCSRLYGGPGDKQEGIDIYGKKSTALKYTVHQCKREKEFGPKRIEAAVNVFLLGEWVSKTEEFVLCTQESLRGKSREDEVIRQQGILQRQNINFRIWDSEELNLELKKFPQIVYDFFGLQWCEVFCGVEAAGTVKVRKALPPKRNYSSVENYLERVVVEVSEASSQNLFSDGRPLWSVIKDKKRIALLGPGYHGKSTELAYAAYTIAKQTNFYPYLVRLKFHTGENIQNYIPEINDIPHSQILLLLDGFDELKTGEFNAARRKIEKFADEYPEIHIVISCRNSFYVTYLNDNSLNTLQGFVPYELKGLSYKQVQDYLDLLGRAKGLNKKNFVAEIHQKRFEEHLYTPYYLIRLVNQFIDEGTLAENIVEITERLIRDNIRKDVARYFPDKRAGKEEAIYKLLRKIAFVLEYTGKNSCTWKELQYAVAPADLELLKAASSLFEGSESTNANWSFTHNNFQEVLVAKALEKAQPHTIRKIVCFPPFHVKVRPTWSNTLSLIIAIVDQRTRKVLIEWLSKEQLELIVRSEPNVIDDRTRFEVFKRVFEHYSMKGSRINESKYNIKMLATFAKNELTADFLAEKLVARSEKVVRINALEMLAQYDDIELNFPECAAKLKSAIEENIYGKESIPYNAIRAYAHGFRLSESEFNTLFRSYVQSEDTWALSALYSAVIRQGKQEAYLNDILEIILRFIDSEHSEREDRLADEYMLLSECVRTINSVESVKQLLTFLKLHYDKIFYSTYFREIIDFALKISATFKSDPAIYEKIKEICISGDVHLADNRNNMFLDYFKKTDQLVAIFKDVYRSQVQISRQDLHQLSKLASPGAIDFIIDELKIGRISVENLSLFQTYLYSNNNELVSDFNQKVNTIVTLPLPDFKDYATEKKRQNDETRRLLFNQRNMIEAVENIFTKLGKDEMTYDEMWELTRGVGHDLSPPVLYEVIRFKTKGQILKKNDLVDRIKKLWQRFSIEEIYRFLKNDKTIEVSDAERQTIRVWCDNQLKGFSFKTATSKTKDGYSVNQNAIYLSFFMRRFNFRDYDEAVYLDMLSFQKWDDDDLDIFEFVSTVLPAERIDIAVLSNLRSKDLYPSAFENHLLHCKKRNLTSAAVLLIPFIESPDTSKRHEALKCFQDLNGDLQMLERSLGNIPDSFRFEIVKVLIAAGSATIVNYVNHQFGKSNDSEIKLRFAFYLIQLGRLKGIRYFISYIERFKEVPISPDAPFSNFLGSVKERKFLPAVFKIYRLGYRTEIQQTNFVTLQHTAATTLNSISLHGNNFPSAFRIYKAFRFLKAIEILIARNESTKKTIRKMISDFDFYFENIEQQFYINKAANITFNEACGVYDMVKTDSY